MDRLLLNGYDDCDVSVILRQLDISESPEVVVDLLRCSWVNLLSDVFSKIGIERSIAICDELCMPAVMNNILNKNIVLNRVYDHNIMNHTLLTESIEKSYGNGYKIIVGSIHMSAPRDLQIISYAYHNGLDVRHIAIYDKFWENDCDYTKFSDVLEHVHTIVCRGFSPRMYDLLLSCKNIKDVEIMSFGHHVDVRRTFVDNFRKCACINNLTRINIDYMNDETLRYCNVLEDLNACNNEKITTCAPFSKTLKKLNAYYRCGINDNELSSCINLEWLDASNNIKITTCKPFAKTLRILYADGSMCGITDDGLRSCTKLRKLYTRSNRKIASCIPFVKTLKTLFCDASCITTEQATLCKKLIRCDILSIGIK